MKVFSKAAGNGSGSPDLPDPSYAPVLKPDLDAVGVEGGGSQNLLYLSFCQLSAPLVDLSLDLHECSGVDAAPLPPVTRGMFGWFPVGW
jgi:hypothetical protein